MTVDPAWTDSGLIETKTPGKPLAQRKQRIRHDGGRAVGAVVTAVAAVMAPVGLVREIAEVEVGMAAAGAAEAAEGAASGARSEQRAQRRRGDVDLRDIGTGENAFNAGQGDGGEAGVDNDGAGNSRNRAHLHPFATGGNAHACKAAHVEHQRIEHEPERFGGGLASLR
ncbi:MAG: hypothetical protein JWR65_3406, partial [Massilia sp.]|nr:hypothetical protein [Massilia sp.]